MGSALQEAAGLDSVVSNRQEVDCSRSWTSSCILFRSLIRTSFGGQTCPVVLFTLAGRVKWGRLGLSIWLVDEETSASAATIATNIILQCV